MHVHVPKPLHGWRAFAGEVGVVVLGVLIALGAQQLAEWVHWKGKQHEILERLFNESRYNVGQLKEFDWVGPEVGREVAFAADLAKGQSCPPLPQWNAILQLTDYPEVSVSSSAYDEVIGSGGLNDVASSQTRDTVAWFHFRLASLQAQTDHLRSIHRQSLIEGDPRVRLSYEPPDRSGIAGIDREALCGDATFRNRVTFAAIDHAKWSGRLRELTEIAIRACGALGRSVGETCTPAVGPPLTPAERRIAQQAFDDAGQG